MITCHARTCEVGTSWSLRPNKVTGEANDEGIVMFDPESRNLGTHQSVKSTFVWSKELEEFACRLRK